MSDKLTHKLIIKERSAKTACGLNVVAFYPNSMFAMTDEAGKSNIPVTIENKGNCPECNKKVKE